MIPRPQARIRGASGDEIRARPNLAQNGGCKDADKLVCWGTACAVAWQIGSVAADVQKGEKEVHGVDMLSEQCTGLDWIVFRQLSRPHCAFPNVISATENWNQISFLTPRSLPVRLLPVLASATVFRAPPAAVRMRNAVGYVEGVGEEAHETRRGCERGTVVDDGLCVLKAPHMRVRVRTALACRGPGAFCKRPVPARVGTGDHLVNFRVRHRTPQGARTSPRGRRAGKDKFVVYHTACLGERAVAVMTTKACAHKRAQTRNGEGGWVLAGACILPDTTCRHKSLPMDAPCRSTQKCAVELCKIHPSPRVRRAINILLDRNKRRAYRAVSVQFASPVPALKQGKHTTSLSHSDSLHSHRNRLRLPSLVRSPFANINPSRCRFASRARLSTHRTPFLPPPAMHAAPGAPARRALLLIALIVCGCAHAQNDPGGNWPIEVPLTNAHRPTGIVAGRGTYMFVATVSGQLWRVDVKSGTVSLINDGGDGQPFAGLCADERGKGTLYVAGRDSGKLFAFNYDGVLRRVYQITPSSTKARPHFVADCIHTRYRLLITDAKADMYYWLPLVDRGPGAGEPAPISSTDALQGFEVKMHGQWPKRKPGRLGSYGIEWTAKWNETGYIMHEGTGGLYAFDIKSRSRTGAIMRQVAVLGRVTKFPGAVGLLFDSRNELVLYVMIPGANAIAVLEMDYRNRYRAKFQRFLTGS
eukprot:IDg8061t1